MSNKNNIQGFFKFIKDALEKQEVPYNAQHWGDMENLLDKEIIQKTKNPLEILNFKFFASSALVIASIAGICFAYFHFNPSTVINKRQDNIAQEQAPLVSPSFNMGSPKSGNHTNGMDSSSKEFVSTEISNNENYSVTETSNNKLFISPDEKRKSSDKTINSNSSETVTQKEEYSKLPLKNKSLKNTKKVSIPNNNNNETINSNPNNTLTFKEPFIDSKENTTLDSAALSAMILQHNSINSRLVNAGTDKGKKLSFLPIKNMFLADTLDTLQDSIAELNNPYWDSVSKPCDTCLLPFFSDQCNTPQILDS